MSRIEFRIKGKQNNDVPEELIFVNAKNVQDNSLNELYVENYSNTEFVSEEDVFEYMKKVSEFLKKYDNTMWRGHKKELPIELFNSFIFGNLISVSAMTRALM